MSKIYRNFLSKCHSFSKWLSSILIIFCFVATTGCTLTSNQTGPIKPISIMEDTDTIKSLTSEQIKVFATSDPVQQASVRNQIITARMYLADLEYHRYESNLTRELQDEGLLATAVSLGLTGSAALIPAGATDRILAGIATGVTGLDKAYTEKELLSNSIQSLQTQMRVDRKTQASVIFAKMLVFRPNGLKAATSIDEYTLPMALSDVDEYYQYGTIGSAIIGLSRTVANAERNAEQAKSDSGPNPIAVSAARATAAPVEKKGTSSALALIPSQASNQAVRPTPGPVTAMLEAMGKYEQISRIRGMKMQAALCVSPQDGDYGLLGSPTRLAIAQFKAGYAGLAIPSRFSETAQTINNFPEQIRLTLEGPMLASPDLCARSNPAYQLGAALAARSRR